MILQQGLLVGINKPMNNLIAKDLDLILTHTNDLWNLLRNKQLFITGGTGFFGSWLLHSFCYANKIFQLNAHATVLTRKPEKFILKEPEIANNKCITLLQGDVRSFSFPNGAFSYFIHGATESSTNLNETNPLEMLQTITTGTQHVLDFASRNPLEGLLYISSGAVYGKQPPNLDHIPESYLGGPDPLLPFSAYAEGKRTAELLCAIHSLLNIKIARCFTFVGPYLSLDAHFAVGDFIYDAIKGGPIVVKGDGTPYRSYLYGADLAIWLWTILFNGRKGEAYNVGSPFDLQIIDVAEAIASKFSPKMTVKVLKTPEIGKPPQRYVPDVSKAEQGLNLSVSVPLDLAIEKMIAWNKDQDQPA